MRWKTSRLEDCEADAVVLEAVGTGEGDDFGGFAGGNGHEDVAVGDGDFADFLSREPSFLA